MGAWSDGALRCNERPTQVAHLLGVLKILRAFLSDPDRALRGVLEDDVSLCSNFAERLDAAIDAWCASSSGGAGCLRFGYSPRHAQMDALPAGLNPFCPGKAAAPTRAGDEVRLAPLFVTVGFLGTVFTRASATLLARLLAGGAAGAAKLLGDCPSPWESLRHAWPMVADMLLNLPQMQHALVYPPLAIEGSVVIRHGSSMGSADSSARWGWAALQGFMREDDYYGAPAWREAYTQRVNNTPRLGEQLG